MKIPLLNHENRTEETDTTLAMPKVGFLGVIELIFWGILLGHFMKWAVDSIYYWIVGADWAPLKDPWDRWAVHLDNLTRHATPLHHFINNGQEAPAWSVTVRHDGRDLLIGLGVALVVKMLLSKPLKDRKDYGVIREAATPLIAILLAAPLWIAIGLFLSKNQFLENHGWLYHGSNPFIIDLWQYFGDRHLQVLIMGILGGFAAGFAVKGPADEAIWDWAERGHRFGPVGLRIRWAFLQAHPEKNKRAQQVRAAEHSASSRRKLRLRNFAISVGTLVFIVAVGYGFWLTTWGPASHAA